MMRVSVLSMLILLIFQEGRAQRTQNNDKMSAKDVVISTNDGVLSGFVDPETGLNTFWGIPFAQPPVGDLRWREPQPVKKWKGIREAKKFGPRPMQKFIYTDMRFRSDSVSEDCLYLNVWTPDTSSAAGLPVLVYFYGGGFVAGDGSEWRYGGAPIAQKGVVVVTANYRLGIFGFFAHPELSSETSYHGSGNYALLDQRAVLGWVHSNIHVFGGNPDHITIAGESAGSFSVSALMASPLSKDLISGAIAESGSLINSGIPVITLREAEKRGEAFGRESGASTLKDLRKIPAGKLLDLGSKRSIAYFSSTIDGYFFPRSVSDIFANGEQAKVPLLVGWNSTESSYTGLLMGKAPTPGNYSEVIRSLYKNDAERVLETYPGNTQEEVIRSATDLACDRFIVNSTWKLAELQRETGRQPVFRYIFSHPRPDGWMPRRSSGLGTVSQLPPPINGAAHSWEIEYALGTLSTNKDYNWTPDDYKVSAVMNGYFVNFIKTGNPNGDGLPLWTANIPGSPVRYIDINVTTTLKDEDPVRHHQEELLDSILNEK